MTPKVISEISDIFPIGGVPDPYLLPELVPLIPDHLLPRAIQVALGISYPDEELRARTVKALAGRLKKDDEALLKETLEIARNAFIDDANKNGLEPALVLTLAPVLPTHLIPIALESALQIVNYTKRIEALCLLVKQLPLGMQESVYSYALEAIRNQEDEGSHAEALMTMIRFLPNSLHDKFRKEVMALSEGLSRVYAFNSLIKVLEGEERDNILEETIAQINAIDNIRSQTTALELVIPDLSPKHVPGILIMVNNITDIPERAYLLALLSGHSDGNEKQAILKEVLELITGIGKDDISARILSEITPLLPRADRRKMIKNIIGYARTLREREKSKKVPGLTYMGSMNNSWQFAQIRATGLGKLASRLPEEERKPLLNDALKEIPLIDRANSRAKTLDELGAILPLPMAEKARGQERRIKLQENKGLVKSMMDSRNFSRNVNVLVRIAKQLPVKEYTRLIPEMMEASRLTESKRYRAQTLIELLKAVPADQKPPLIDEVLELISTFDDTRDRARLLPDLVLHLSGDRKSQIEKEIITATRSLTDETGKISILEKLIPVVTEASMRDLVEISDSFKERWHLLDVLKKMTVHFPPSMLHGEFEKLLSSLGSADENERTRLLEGLGPVLPSDLLPKALDMARNVRIRPLQARAVSALLSNLARQLTGKEQDEFLIQAIKEAFYTGPFYGGKGGISDPISIGGQGVKAREMLLALPDAQREALLREWLGTSKTTPDESVTISSKRSEPVATADENLMPMTGETGKETGPSNVRVVNTGFSEREQPDHSLDKETSLASGRPYYFWFDIDTLDVYSIEKEPTAILTELVPSEAMLKIVLFGFPDEIAVTDGADVGELKLLPNGGAIVNKQPTGNNILLPPDLREKRLFFPVTTPVKPGVSRLRCHIYYEQILVQARLIKVEVSEHPLPKPDALNSVVYYTISDSLRPDHLNNLDNHLLSLMLSKTHALIFGQQEFTDFKNEARVTETELIRPINDARRAMMKASWGDQTPWKEQPYKYLDGKPDIERLKNDIINLAITGYHLYNAIIDKLTGGREKSYELAKLMLAPGRVQIVLEQSPNHLLPAALLYDYPLHAQAEKHRLCDAFINSLNSDEPLEETPCFKGNCPSRGNLEIVCPSGFWGFRHFLGMPVSLNNCNYQKDVPTEIFVKEKTEFIVGVATNLGLLEEHMKKLKTLLNNLDWHYSDKSQDIINLLGEVRSHIIYFYCHGFSAENKSLYLQVGKGNDYIDGSILMAKEIQWKNPSPLVFINGCETAAVDPEQAMSLVQDFISSGSAGVIGTEITVFEPLACSFAEEFLRLFLTCKLPIGEAVRNARLKLLKAGNPLGLIYTPFVIPSLKIKTSR